MRSVVIAAAVALALSAQGALADKQPFDLAGPSLEATVTRGGVTLPIGAAPDLAAGDRLHVVADLPADESERYLLVAAFLRGAANPPPKSWFFAAPTWDRKHPRGLDITVPAGAQQALLFLAPHTGGDLSTLQGAVRARPGVFVRAAQDLEQLDLERTRLETFLEGLRRLDRTDPGAIKTVSGQLARSLGVKLDESCFSKPANQQAACLQKGQDALVLDDGHTASMAQTLATGSPADLISQMGGAPVAGGGAYSPYVGAVLDIVRILDGLHTAHFQYIPALGLAEGPRLSLRLNSPPSFANPKSVLIIALPAVAAAPPPPLRLVDPQESSCVSRTGGIIPVDGAPLIFATGYARKLALRVRNAAGRTFEIPLEADPAKGGLVLQAATDSPADFAGADRGLIHGDWGFGAFTGPTAPLETAGVGGWVSDPDEAGALVAGRAAPLKLTGGPAACVDKVSLQMDSEASEPVTFKVEGAQALTLDLPLQKATPGSGVLTIAEAGGAPRRVDVTVAAETRRFERLVYHAGDQAAVLDGTGLASVAEVKFGGAAFAPGAVSPAEAGETLALSSSLPIAAKAGARLAARIVLKTGPVQKLEATVLPARPRIAITARALDTPSSGGLSIKIGDPSAIPRGAVLTFTLSAPEAEPFGAHETVEVATADGAWSTRLSGAALVVADPQTAVATLDTSKAFGLSAWGPLRVRLIDDRGASDWQPLGPLVRLPDIQSIACTKGAPTCRLTGSELFLISQVAAGPDFATPVLVPDGFPGSTLDTPRPKAGRLYVRLHDDPAAAAVIASP